MCIRDSSWTVRHFWHIGRKIEKERQKRRKTTYRRAPKKMDIKPIKLLIILLLGGVIAGCKVPPIATQREFEPLPATFENRADTGNSAQVQWRDYFQDSTLTALIETALVNNFDALTAIQRIEMARSNVRATEGLLKPTIWGGGTTALRRFGLYTMDAVSYTHLDVYKRQQVTRYNMYPSAELNGEPAEGYSSGSAIEAVQATAREKHPTG